MLDFYATVSGLNGFVVRATDLHSNYGIYVLPNGFNGLEFIRGIDMSAQDVISDLTTLGATTVIIEEYVGSEVSLPIEVKFHMFNGQVGSVNVVSNRGTECACTLLQIDFFAVCTTCILTEILFLRLGGDG